MMVQQVDDKAYRYALLQVAVERFGELYNKLPAEKRCEVERIASKKCAIHNLILNSREAAQVAIPENRVDVEVKNVIARFANENSFEQELEKNELDRDCFEKLVRRGLRVEAVMDFVASKSEPCSEVSARLYYYMNIDKFRQPELREVRHILITINPEFPENERAAAFNRAKAIAARLQKKSNRFSEQALKYSECPTAVNGGNLGILKRGVLFPTLDAELFKMRVGDVSDVIETPMGFHVLMCESIQSSGVVSIVRALPRIIEKLTEKNQKTYQRNWLSGLLKAH